MLYCPLSCLYRHGFLFCCVTFNWDFVFTGKYLFQFKILELFNGVLVFCLRLELFIMLQEHYSLCYVLYRVLNVNSFYFKWRCFRHMSCGRNILFRLLVKLSAQTEIAMFTGWVDLTWRWVNSNCGLMLLLYVVPHNMILAINPQMF